jgi:tRNA A-37 threonylcarbamoyl transferase component Bud32
MVDIDNFLLQQIKRVNILIQSTDQNQFDESTLYQAISNEQIQYIFIVLHHEFNELFSFMNTKASKSSNNYYNAGTSRRLIECNEIYNEMVKYLKGSNCEFEIEEKYRLQIAYTTTFLQEYNGSAIPNNYEFFEIVKYQPIFWLNYDNSMLLVRPTVQYMKKTMIGEGSYAIAYKYKDNFYNCSFVEKRAKKDLDEKEIQRFKNEYQTLKALESPYIITVYRLTEDPLAYVMEYCDMTLFRFIKKYGNMLDIASKKKIVLQILKGFEYIHSKGLLHRDISFKNIFVNSYDEQKINIIKIADFGLVKIPDSTMTSLETNFKGSLNDPKLREIGFSNYSMIHETYALTRVVYFVMTGRESVSGEMTGDFKTFIHAGVSEDSSARFQSVMAMRNSFVKINWLV